MSLLPLAGMFIFGGDKKKKKRLEEEKKYREKIERMYEEASRKYGIPKEKLEKILLFGIYNGGHVKILKKVTMMPEKKIFEILDANYTIPDRHIYIIPSRKKWRENTREPYTAHLAQIHPILAVAAAEHTKTYTRDVGHAVGDAINRIYKDGIYLELKKDPTPLIDAIYEELVERGVPIPNTKKFYEDTRKAFRIASKIADKIVIMDKDPETIETAARIMAGHVEDPEEKLKEMGIDITQEIEELRQVFAEISGKKIEKKPVKRENSPLSVEARELLGILRGLKYARYSREAVGEAKKELEEKAQVLLQNPVENLELLGLYFAVITFMEKGKFEEVERLLESLK